MSCQISPINHSIRRRAHGTGPEAGDQGPGKGEPGIASVYYSPPSPRHCKRLSKTQVNYVPRRPVKGRRCHHGPLVAGAGPRRPRLQVLEQFPTSPSAPLHQRHRPSLDPPLFVHRQDQSVSQPYLPCLFPPPRSQTPPSLVCLAASDLLLVPVSLQAAAALLGSPMVTGPACKTTPRFPPSAAVSSA